MITAKKLQDEWLLSYAAGALDPGRSLMVSSHIAYHDDLQEAVNDAEKLGGTLLDSLDQSQVSNSTLDQILGRLDDAVIPEVRTSDSAAGRFPEPLMEFIDCDMRSLNWRLMGPGMSNARLWDGPNDEKLWLLRARGGIVVPEHGHTGDEWTLVLNGSYHTAASQYLPGDLEVADNDIEHQPNIDPDEECMCLVFTSGPLQFKSLTARIAQPFIGL